MPRPEAEVRLFCFPYGGSGPGIFRHWPERLSDSIEAIGILYPGRESRSMESLVPDIEQLAEAMLPGMLPYLEKPFALFGHSLGALLSFELARRLADSHNIHPEHLFVAGATAPHYPVEKPIHHLSDEQFLTALIGMRGMPDAILANHRLLEYALPIIRNDFAACANYQPQSGTKLACGLTAFAGKDDPRARLARVEAWQQYTAAGFTQQVFSGGHFFIHDREQDILASINAELSGLSDSASG